MSVSWLHKGCIFFISFIMVFTISSKVFGAMDPAEVQERNENAAYQVVGKVTADEFVQEMTTENRHPKQIRKMTVQIAEVIKAPDDVKQRNTVEVYYYYIPSWMADEFVGGNRMDITVGDVIKIFLSKGDIGWEPVVGGNSVEHITYKKDRAEHISEPFLHSLTRWIGNLRFIKTDILILCGLSAVLIWAIFRVLRKTT